MSQTSKAFPYSSFIPGYGNGLGLTITSNTVVTVAPGSVLDSTGTFQLSLGTAQAVKATNTGLNGIDTGTFASSTVYAVYLVADPVTQQATGAIISTALPTVGPLMPFGYSAYALVGYAVTNASTNFLPGYYSAGNDSRRTFMYDAPQATAVTAGAATTYTAVDLSHLVPGAVKRPVWIATSFTPGAASRTLNLQPVSGTGAPITVTGQVESVVVTTNSYLFDDLATGVPEINYKVSNGGDAVAINVAGFDFWI